MDLAWNLVNGKMQMGAITYDFVPHTPMFYLISGSAFYIFGYNIVVARTLTAICGIFSTIILYFLGKELVNDKVGLTSSLLFAIFPLAVLYNRWFFDYNLLQLLGIFTFFASIKYLKTNKRRWFYVASISAGVASLTSLIGIGLVVGLFVLIFINKNIKMTLKGILLASGIFAFFPLSMLVLNWSNFIFDINYLFSASGGSGPTLFDNCKTLTFYSPWITLGILGLLLYPFFFGQKKGSAVVLGFFSCFFVSTVGLYTISGDHIRGIIQLFPFFSLGLALGIWGLLQNAINPVQKQLYKILKNARTKKVAIGSAWLGLLVLFAVLLTPMVISDFQSVVTGFNTPLDNLCTLNPDAAYNTADYINSNVNSDDIVLSSPHIWWLIKCKTTDLIQSQAIEHKEIIFYPKDMPESRFAFNCSYQNAKYWVVDYFSKNWYFRQASLNCTISDILTNWEVVYQYGEYTVYRNPSFPLAINVLG